MKVHPSIITLCAVSLGLEYIAPPQVALLPVKVESVTVPEDKSLLNAIPPPADA